MIETLRHWRREFAVHLHALAALASTRRVYVVAHTHGTVSGWLVPFQTERNYIVNNHVSHIEHLAAASHYAFAASEVPNLIALRQLRPDAFDTLLAQTRRKSAELVNAFFLEPTINLTQGETLMRMGIEGLRWQNETCGAKPRFAWMIDAAGVHTQMPAIVSHLGLEALVYSRNCAGSTAHWWESPSGDRVLAVSLGRECYINWRLLFAHEPAFERVHTDHLHKALRLHLDHSPDKLPVLWVVAGGDYGTAPVNPKQIEHFLPQWKRAYPGIKLVFATPGAFLDDFLTRVRSRHIATVKGDNLFSHNAFWVNNPTVKQGFRAAESRLLAVEASMALQNVLTGHPYPSASLTDAWYLLFMNADRGLLWGIGSGAAFYGEASWTAQDRFTTINTLLDGIEAAPATDGAVETICFHPQAGSTGGLRRLRLPDGLHPAGQREDAWGGGESTFGADPEGMGFYGIRLASGAIGNGRPVPLPEKIDTPFYQVRICPQTGDLLQLTLPGPRPKPVLAGHSNRLRFERQPGVVLKEDFVIPRSEREAVTLIAPAPPSITCREDDVSLVVDITDQLHGGGRVRRRLRFFTGQPLIDAEIELTDVPDDYLVSVNFSLATAIATETRAVPYGFSERDLRFPQPNLPSEPFLMADHAEFGLNAATVPAIGWSWHGDRNGVGLAILDRGVPGRESHGRTAALMLMNTSPGFRGKRNDWLSGAGRHVFRYSLLPTAEGWRQANTPALAAALNMPMYPVNLAAPSDSLISASRNLAVHSVRRHGGFLEVRCAEALGEPATATLTASFAHRQASRGTAVTATPLTGIRQADGATRYQLHVRPQEIITLRFAVESEVPTPAPLSDWQHLVPPHKRAGLSTYDPALAGHPPEADPDDGSTGTGA